LVGSVVVVIGLVAMLMRGSRAGAGAGREGRLVVYCAASQREAMQAVVEDYQREFGVEVRMSFGASQAELVTLERAGDGDIYLPADESYIEMAKGKGLVEEVIGVAVMRPILAVKRGNLAGGRVKSIGDLVERREVKLGQANPEAAAIGKVVREALSKTGRWEEVNGRTTVFLGTVNEVANALKIGSIDAGFIWDAMLWQYPELEAVEVAELKDVSSRISVAVLKTSRDPEGARKFARYLTTRGLEQFSKRGFKTIGPERR
jgi:molybdate transport system substrate-binding protein